MSNILHRAASAVALALVASTAYAGVETQQIEYAWDVASGNEPVTFDVVQFDDRNGTRILDGVNFELDASYILEMLVENLEEFAVSEGAWFVESATFMQLWVDGDIEGVITSGGLGVFSADLAANDGVLQEGPDSVAWDYTGPVNGSFDIESSETGQFVGDGVVEAGVYPYLSLAINAPPPLYDLWIMTHQNSGTMTVSYTYHTTVGDLDGDGQVGFSDLTQVLGAWGACSGCLEDLDGNGQVGFSDLTLLLGNWGPVGG